MDSINETIEKHGNVYKVYSKKKVNSKRKLLGTHPSRKKAVDQLQAIEAAKAGATNESKILSYVEFINEKKKETAHPRQYKAPEGSSRDRKLDKAKSLLASGKKEEAYRLRDEMEKKVRSNPDWKNTPRKDSKVNEAKSNNLSKETLEKIRKVATKKGYSFSDLKKEYIKGLGAYYSSGSRPGMTAHQWAMARVNAASPSESWANVKKTK
ncbi:hypothetical protein UFOVP699_6 [uncultured Caudovirales phage]|uniref:DUF5824 domain-containing protein n=1 Tax=uncultured Caudovirales phage TaxID=2100421 RepID=A0A6J5NMK7_9CAUD|nr:hypothetical protein UFOVP699_6 [uncultured Caudovirales phage]